MGSKRMADSTRPRIGILKKLVSNIREGDRVVWIVFVLLLMISLVAIFSSTSTMAKKDDTTRLAIYINHLKVVGGGLLIVFLLSSISSIKLYRIFSSAGFIISAGLLVCLLARVQIGNFIRVGVTNGAVRAISIGGFSLAVYEVVKVAMVMYLAWAIQTYDNNGFRLSNRLGTKYPKLLGWMKSPMAQRWIYIFGPALLITAMIFPGSTGSAIMICIVMFVTILIGGMKWKPIIGAMLVAASCVTLIIGIHILSSGKIIQRMQTAFNRLSIELPYPDALARQKQREAIAVKHIDISELSTSSQEFRDYKDAVLQPMAAEIALVQGGRHILGKGAGKSSQRYVVPVIYEDYMFSLIVEEYGLLAGFFLIVLYLSLFARGVIIVDNSSNRFAKACVGGLVFLITFQSLFHILVNCNVGIVTGQTLPLVSHGRCSFLCFCVAFGIILSISILVNKKIKVQQEAETALMAKDDVSAAVDMVEELDEQLEEPQKFEI